MLLLLQVTSIFLLFIRIDALKPPGYVKPLEEPDKNPPKYEYGYNIEDEKGLSHGKLESRDGIYALGRYYVQNKDSSHNVQYYADDWGYHPFIEYSNVGPHSKSSTQLLLGVEAVKALATNKFTPNTVPPKQHVTDTINQFNVNRPGKALLQPTQPQIVYEQTQPEQQQVVIEQPQAQQQQILVEQPQPQQSQVVIEHQPQVQQQQIIIEQPQPQQQQIFIEQPQPQQQQVLLEHPQHPQVLLQPPQQHQQQVFYVQQQAQKPEAIQENLILSSQPQQIIHESSSQEQYDEASLSQANFGGYGSKINIVDKTKNLVSGQDVLNLNHAVDESIQTTTNIESTTAKSVVTEYNTNLEHTENHNIVQEVEINNQPTESSLIEQPIVVADIGDKTVSPTTTDNYIGVKEESSEEIYSTTANTVETVSTHSYDSTEPSSTILVTPRPVSTNFLAPITAGIQLQNVVEHTESIEASSAVDHRKQNYLVEIQKSLPYYLGKFEYVQNPTAVGYNQHQTITTNTQTVSHENLQQKAVENIELGKTLLALPEPQPLVADKFVYQQLPEQTIRENFIEVDQQQEQGYQHHVTVQQPTVVEKIVEKKVPYPVVETKIIEKPVEVTKIVNTPYPVEVPVHIPYEVRVPVEKPVHVHVPVEKIVEKPITITKYVDRPIHVPQPYPVEKIVDRPIQVPVEVTRYIDRPYPVQVQVPYPVDRIVEKIVKQPYPVEVRVPVQVKVPVEVQKIVEKQIPVHHYIEKQVPVEKIVEKPVPHYIDRPYPVHVQVPVPTPTHQSYIVPQTYQYTHYRPSVVLQSQKYVATYNNQNIHSYSKEQQSQGSQQYTHFQNTPQIYAPTHLKAYLPPKQPVGYLPPKQTVAYLPPKQSTEYLPPKPTQYLPPQQQEYLTPKQTNNGYLPPVHDCDQQNSYSSQNSYYTIKPDDYIGLLPPKSSNNGQQYARKYRSARSNFNNNLRLEYGFMPPLIPSLEIDENGKPLDRDEHK